MGISTSRYLPAMGTAGLERLAVNGYNLDPAPPPKMMLSISLDIDIAMNVYDLDCEKLRNNFVCIADEIKNNLRSGNGSVQVNILTG
jgi:hypothetical protein